MRLVGRARVSLRAIVLGTVVAMSVGVSPAAIASTAVPVTALEVARGVLGPNSGTLTTGSSHFGATPVFAISLPTSTTKVTALRLEVSGTGIRVPIDFDRLDGFQLYHDFGTPGFDRMDYFQGPVNAGYAVGTTDASGRTPVTLKFYDATRLTGTDYVLTVRPSSAPLADRSVRFTVPAGGISTTSGALPTEAVTTSTVRIDSLPPADPDVAHFEVVPKPPGSVDLVAVRDEEREPGLRWGFFNHSVDASMANLLVQPDTIPAISPASDATIPIGDGSGITATKPVANNNQTSDALYVRAVDGADNVSDPAQLANDVTAPRVSSAAVTVVGSSITQANRNRVIIRSVTSGAFDAVRAEGWLRAADPVTGAEAARTPTVSVAYAPTVELPPIDSDPLGGDELKFTAEVRVLDAAGNATNVLSSASVAKDTLGPAILGVSRVTQRTTSCPGSIGASGASLATDCTVAGDTFHVTFSEPMDPASIATTTVGSAPPARGVNNALKLIGASGTDRPTWGAAPGWAWDAASPGGYVLGGTVTVDTAPPGTRLVLTEDTVEPIGVHDRAGNAVAGRSVVERVGVKPQAAKTNDLLGARWGQTRDGHLDTVDVTFSGSLDADSVRRSIADFRIINGTEVVPASATPLPVDATGKTVVRLEFASQWGTGAVPIVAYGVNGGRTIRSSGSFVPANAGAVVAVDGAPPLPVSVSTADDSVNGRIDALVVRYSEPINHATEAPRGYVVPGYETNSETFPAAKWNAFTPTTGTSDTTRVLLAESQSFDTSARPSMTFTGNSSPGSEGVKDAAGNTLARWTTTSADPTVDGAPPLLLTRSTLDINADGYLDVIVTNTTEPLATSSLSRGQFVVDDRPVEGIVPISTEEQWILVGARAFSTGPDTDDTPLVQYLGGRDAGITDASPSRVPLPRDGASVVALDGAGPAIVGAVPVRGTLADEVYRVRVQMSETVDAGTLDLDDFFIRQAGDFIFPSETRLLGDGRTVELTLPVTYRPGADASVELSQPGAVWDAASPQNLSSDGSPIVLSPVPSAVLTAHGPGASRPGFSTSRTVSVIAKGNELAAAWLLLADPTADPAPTDPRFVADPPQSFTFATDGPHRLTLWTRSSQGELSTPATVSITVDRTAPAITTSRVDYVNPDAAWGLRSDDQLRVVARATGADAAAWAAADTRADYSSAARAPNMASVAPLSFTLTSPAGRAMEFPFIKTSGAVPILPAGTVVRPAGETGPTYFLAQTSTGRQYLRPMSAAVRTSYAIRSADVIPLPAAAIGALSTGTPMRVRDGSLVRASTGSATVYAVFGGVRRAVSAAALKALRYAASAVIVMPAAEVSSLRLGSPLGTSRHPVGTYVRSSDGKVYRISTTAGGAAVRRRVASPAALATLVRSIDVVPALAADLKLPLDALVLGVRDGALCRDRSTGRYFVASHGLRRHFAANVMAARMGYVVSSAHTAGTGDLTMRTGTTRVDGPVVTTRNVPVYVSVGDQAGNVTRLALSVPFPGRPESFAVAGYVVA